MNRWIVLTVCVYVFLFISSCANVESFAGDWVGSGIDSDGNKFTFAAKVVNTVHDQYRVLILDALDTQKDPMHVMDGCLKGSQYTYTADDGLYTGGGTLAGNEFSGFYKGPIDGTFTMHRIR